MVFHAGNMLFHRMVRQTGHTAAMKKLLSNNFLLENNLYVFGVFHTSRERDELFKQAQNINTGKVFPVPDIDKNAHTGTIRNVEGTNIHNADIVVFSDTLHDPRRLSDAMDCIGVLRPTLNKVKLFVFLG